MTKTARQKAERQPQHAARPAGGKSNADIRIAAKASGSRPATIWPAATLAAFCFVLLCLYIAAPRSKTPLPRRATQRFQVYFMSLEQKEKLYNRPEKYAVWSPAAISLPDRAFQRKASGHEISREIPPPLQMPNKNPLFVERPQADSPPSIPAPESRTEADTCARMTLPDEKFPGSASDFPPLPGAALHEPALSLSAGLRNVETDFTPLLTEPWPATDMPVTLSAHVKFHSGNIPPSVLLEQTADDPLLTRRFALLLRQCAAFQSPAEGTVSLRLPLNGAIPH